VTGYADGRARLFLPAEPPDFQALPVSGRLDEHHADLQDYGGVNPVSADGYSSGPWTGAATDL